MALVSAVPEDLNVLPKETGAGPSNRAYGRQLASESYAAFARRTAAYESLKTPEQIAAYQSKQRDFFVKQIGGYPERTPLNWRKSSGGGNATAIGWKDLVRESTAAFCLGAFVFAGHAAALSRCDRAVRTHGQR